RTPDAQRLHPALRLTAALTRYCYLRAYLSEGRARTAAVLARLPAESVPDELAGDYASVLSGAGILAEEQGDHQAAREFHERSLALRRERADQEGIASSLNNLGALAFDEGKLGEAHALFGESAALYRELGNRWGISMALTNLANTLTCLGKYPEAEP